MNEEHRREILMKNTKADLVESALTSEVVISEYGKTERELRKALAEATDDKLRLENELEESKRLAQHFADRSRELAEAVIEMRIRRESAEAAERRRVHTEVTAEQMAEVRRRDDNRPQAMTMNYDDSDGWKFR